MVFIVPDHKAGYFLGGGGTGGSSDDHWKKTTTYRNMLEGAMLTQHFG